MKNENNENAVKEEFNEAINLADNEEEEAADEEYGGKIENFVLTNLMVERTSFKSTKDPRKLLYAYEVKSVYVEGAYKKEFNINLIPAVDYNAQNDFMGFMWLDIIFMNGNVPLYLQITTDKRPGERKSKRVIKYYVVRQRDDGSLVKYELKPRSLSDRVGLEFFLQKYINNKEGHKSS